MTMLYSSLLQELEEVRRRTDRLFGLIGLDAMYARPIPERHRLIFYLGHLEAFDWNQLCRWTLGKPAFHASFDQLFEAGIDPAVGTVSTDTPSDWPTIQEVEGYTARVREEVDQALEWVPEEMVHVAIEHRLMHVETTVYLLHHLGFHDKPAPLSAQLSLNGQAPSEDMIDIPEGSTRLGRCRGEGFGWDNECEEHEVFVPAFAINRYKTTNEQYLQFVNGKRSPKRYNSSRKGSTGLSGKSKRNKAVRHLQDHVQVAVVALVFRQVELLQVPPQLPPASDQALLLVQEYDGSRRETSSFLSP